MTIVITHTVEIPPPLLIKNDVTRVVASGVKLRVTQSSGCAQRQCGYSTGISGRSIYTCTTQNSTINKRRRKKKNESTGNSSVHFQVDWMIQSADRDFYTTFTLVRSLSLSPPVVVSKCSCNVGVKPTHIHTHERVRERGEINWGCRNPPLLLFF